MENKATKMRERRQASTPGWLHGFYDYAGNATDFETWVSLKDDVGAEFVNGRLGLTFVSTCFRGDDADGEIILWQTRVWRLPQSGFSAARYITRADAVLGHGEIVAAEAALVENIAPIGEG